MEMELDVLAAQIQAAHQRRSELYRLGEGTPTHPGTLKLVLAELDTSLEELRAAEEELHAQSQELLTTRQLVDAERRRYQALFDGAPDGYLVTSLAGTIHAANRAASILLNLPPHFIPGVPLTQFIAKHDRQRFQDALSRLRSTGHLANWVVGLQPRNQAPIDVEITVSAERDARDHIVALRWLLREVRARTQAQRIDEQADVTRRGQDCPPSQALAMPRETVDPPSLTAEEIHTIQQRYVTPLSALSQIAIHRRAAAATHDIARLLTAIQQMHTERDAALADAPHPQAHPQGSLMELPPDQTMAALGYHAARLAELREQLADAVDRLTQLPDTEEVLPQFVQIYGILAFIQQDIDALLAR